MIEVKRFTLPNGLRVVHHHDPVTAMVALNLLYDVGARDEDASLTGIAHLFEHLMFGGSVSAPDFDGMLERAGGTNNAWTSNDFTNFYDVVPAVNAATAFFLESDRMLALGFDPHVLDVQKSVVIEEFRERSLNQPYGDLWHKLRPLVYGGNHPYSWPVIGKEISHIEKVADDDVRRWFYSHYAPNNAVLAVTGRITFDETRRLAEEWFGRVPRRDVVPRNIASPEFPNCDVVTNVYGNVPEPLVTIAIPMAPHGTQEYYAADVITDLLANGRSSRLFRRLVMEGDGLFIEANASIMGSEHEGMLLLTGRLSENTPQALDVCRQRLYEECRHLVEPGEVTKRELERVKNKFESTFTFGNISYAALAASLALAEMHGEDINRRVERQRSVTVDDVRSTADLLFNHTPSVTLNYLSAEG